MIPGGLRIVANRASSPFVPPLFTFLLVLNLGCAGPGRSVVSGAANPTGFKAKPAHIDLAPLVVTPLSEDEIAAIHERGMRQLQNGAAAAAEKDFGLCVQASPMGALAPSALYHGALALDDLGRFDEALGRFLEVTERFDKSDFARDAAIRATRLACHLEKWEIARSLAETLLARSHPLRPSELILVRGALALHAVSRGDDLGAEPNVARARDEIEKNGLDAPGRIHRDVAAVYFALGEIRRLRAERIALAPPPQNFAERLEQRCELILGAQSAYSDAMRAFEAHWSTMAGYRTGELYSALHEELMRISPPDTAKAAGQRQLFQGAMRVRYSVLVEKALILIRHTVAMAERTGERSEWVTRAKAAEQDLAQRLLDEQRAIDALPYSRQAIEQGLYSLQKTRGRAK
jgi:tetratricopeptide (TPR) repeat protein